LGRYPYIPTVIAQIDVLCNLHWEVERIIDSLTPAEADEVAQGGEAANVVNIK
jgi:hypothetical protein